MVSTSWLSLAKEASFTPLDQRQAGCDRRAKWDNYNRPPNSANENPASRRKVGEAVLWEHALPFASTTPLIHVSRKLGNPVHPFVPCGTNHYPETTWRDENPEKAAFHGSAVKNCEGLVAGGHGLIGPVVNVHGSWQQPLGVPQAAKYAPPPPAHTASTAYIPHAGHPETFAFCLYFGASFPGTQQITSRRNQRKMGRQLGRGVNTVSGDVLELLTACR